MTVCTRKTAKSIGANCKKFNERRPDHTMETGPVAILWDFIILTDRRVKGNCPEKVIKYYLKFPVVCNNVLKNLKTIKMQRS